MDIVLLRHGKTVLNKNGCFCGRSDVSLSIEGIDEILRAKKLLKGIEFESIYYSPLKRTCESLNILGLDGIPDDRIREYDFGIFEGLTYNEILEKYPAEEAKWRMDYLNYRIPKGESLRDLYIRVCDFLNEITQKNEKSLVIAHDGVIKCALCWVFDKPDYFYRFKIDHGSLTIISSNNDFSYIKGLNIKEPLGL